MTTAIFIPSATVSHATAQPYISVAEYQNAPTAVSTDALVAGSLDAPSTAQANLIELSNVVNRASRWADRLCNQILAATLDTETWSNLYVRRDGSVHALCSFFPFRELDSFTAGPTPSTMMACQDTADIWLQGRRVLVVPVAGLLANNTNGLVGYGFPGPLWPGNHCYAQATYWNGWFHSTLATGFTTPGQMSLPLTTTLPQSAAGVQLTIVDGSLTEIVTVASTFTGGTNVPLASPTANAHSPGSFPQSITVTELPADARQAVISLTSALIKTQGMQAYTMESVGGAPTHSALIESGGLEDLSVAVDILSSGQYVRVV